MSWQRFVNRLTQLQQERTTDLVLMLNPRPFLLPALVQSYDDPYLPFGKMVINATRDLVCAYMFDFAAYLGMGAAGAVALERTIAYAGQENLTILHAPFTGQAYAAAADSTGFGVDAITLTFTADLPFYLAKPPHAALVVSDDENGIPEQGGIYSPNRQTVQLHGLDGAMITLRVTDDNVLYGNGTVDFADYLRTAVKALQA